MRIAGKFDYIHFADKCSQLLYYKTEKNSAVKKYKNDSLSPSETVESQFVRSIHFFEPSLWLPVNNFPGFPLWQLDRNGAERARGKESGKWNDDVFKGGGTHLGRFY